MSWTKTVRIPFNQADRDYVAIGNLNALKDKMRIDFDSDGQNPYLTIASRSSGIERDLEKLGIPKDSVGTPGWKWHCAELHDSLSFYTVSGLENLVKLADLGVEIPAAVTFKGRGTSVAREPIGVGR